ncbi:MAG: TIGR04283 family arsenosugar biosynthesis glycosyltransferase [Bryobacteraceae bacterium]
MRVSIIIPAVNEEAIIGETLAAVSRLRPFEIIVADGGSIDRTVTIASDYGRIVQAGQGRGLQQRVAAKTASGDVLWFLHADSIPVFGAIEAITDCLDNKRLAGGNFSICFDGDGQSARRLTAIYPWLRVLGLCYGDSGIFVRKSTYDSMGGFKPYPLFEDVDLVRRLRKVGEFRTLPHKVMTSSRRFEHRHFGVMFAEWTVLQMLYWAGVSPYVLARWYKAAGKRESRSISG